jgi:DNA recombination protein RmuC
METQLIVFLIIGFILGGLTGYFLLKLFQQRGFIRKSEFELLQKENTDLKMENIRRISPEELSQKFVSKELHEAANSTLNVIKEELRELKNENDRKQEVILRLTSESEQKLTREEVEKGYVSREAFDMLKGKLEKAEKELNDKIQTIQDLNRKITEISEQEKSLNEKLTTFYEEIGKLHSLSQQQFKNLATDILEEKKKLFIESNKSAMNTILDPLKSDLSVFKKTVEETRKEDIRDLTSLKKEIESLQKLNVQLSDDAQHLANALKSEVKVQGNWGEDRLNMILETEGLQKYIDYTSQGSYKDEEQDRTRKPDFILRLPQGRHLIIDSKVSLTAYANYFNAETPHEKEKQLKLHLKSLIDHIDELAAKNYQSLAGINSPDYVFMFMPIEGALTLAMNSSSEIFDRALKKKIVIITPTTLVATLKVIKILWQQENQVKNVEEIFRQFGALYDKFVTFVESLDQVGSGINNASQAFQQAMNHLSEGTKKGSTIIGRFETIRKLEAKTNKRLPDKLLASIDYLSEEETPGLPEEGSAEIIDE